MKLLIAGGTSFIGSSLRAGLTSAGHMVVSVSRSLHASNPLERSVLGPVLAEHRPDVLIHCAGSSSVAQAQNDPHQAFESDVRTVSETLAAIRESSPRTKFVLISSAAVYGERGTAALAESLAPRPISVYGHCKALAEDLTRQYAAQFGIATLVLRPFSVYSENQRKQVVFDLCAKLSKRPQALSLMGTGNETRDFLHAEDLSAELLALLAAGYSGTVNAGTGVATTIADLAASLARSLSPETRIEFTGEGRPIDPQHLVADTALARSLGAAPAIGLQEGLDRVVRGFPA